MKSSDLFPSKYVSASDIETPITVTMDRITMEEVGEGREELPVLHFSDHPKGLVLNKTNTKKIASLHGGETQAWADNQIQLVRSTTSYKGEEVECIRIKQATAVPQ